MSATRECESCGTTLSSDRPAKARFCNRKCQLAARIHTTVRFSPDVRDRLFDAAEERDLSVNWLINKAVREFLDRVIPADDFKMTRDP